MQKLLEKLGFSESAASAALWIILSIVLVAVIALLAMWLVRTLRPSLNINGGANRGGRPQRLAITDAFPLDRDGRKLVIVRRDNTEHLLLIGGPNDVLVEGNITRHDRASRSGGRGMENEADDAPMPAAPHMTVAPQMPVAPMVPPPAPMVVAPTPQPVAPQPVPPPFVSPAPAPQPPVMTPPAAPLRREPITPPPAAPTPAPAPVAAVAPPVLTLEALLADATPVSPDAKPEVRTEPVVELTAVEATSASAPATPPAPEPPAPAPARPPAMSEMARRLNEALQKPVSGTLRPPFNRSIPPAPPTSGPSASPTPPVTPVATPAAPAPAAEAPPKPAPLPAAEPVAKADMDLLEEEMARLLGRPAQPKKTDGP